MRYNTDGKRVFKTLVSGSWRKDKTACTEKLEMRAFQNGGVTEITNFAKLGNLRITWCYKSLLYKLLEIYKA
jgi:hypothetical protein